MTGREPLTADERELQRRLGHWPVAGPPESLDARILAQARAAAAASTPVSGAGLPRPRQHRHRPLIVGVASAAALVLTVGLVWRVAEQPGPTELPPATAPAQMRASEPATSRRQSASDQATSAREQGAQRERGAASRAAGTVAPAPATAGSDRTGRAAPVLAEPQAPAPREPAPLSETRTAPMPTPPAARIRAEASESLDAAGRDDVETFAAPPPPPAPPAPAAPGPDAFERELAQVRDLIARGEQTAARGALLELRRRHPQRPLPDDLRAWLQRTPTP